jgi:hypothetical protein
MADLLDRLQTIAVGGPARLAPPPRGRFEPDRDGRERPAWIEEEHEEIDAAPGRATAGPAPTADERASRSSIRGAPAAEGPHAPPVARTEAAGPPAAPSAPTAPAAPVPVDGQAIPAATSAVPEAPGPVEPAPASAAPFEVHTVQEVDHVREVATVEHRETAATVVELVRWIEEGPTESGDVPPPPEAVAAAGTGEADTAGAEQAVSSGPIDAPDAVSRPDVLPDAPTPRVTVSIDRLEVRTAPEPRATVVVPPPAPEPALEFAGPSLDEFLGGVG